MKWEDERPEDLRERVKSLPGRKNTREWCRGKVGRRHEVEVRLDPQMVSMNDRAGRPTLCHRWQYGNERYRLWICYHQIVCVNCGKILNHSLGSDCPDRTIEPEVTTGT